MNWMIYGANGYTGELIAREAVTRGERPILAGRNGDAVLALARELGLESRVFSLDDDAIRQGLSDVDAVLHCAGPFSRTSAPMVEACLAQRVHYLDITGEIAVFEAIFARDDAAREAGILLLPGVGFDVVPTDCLALMLSRRLPEATELTLAFSTRGGGMSRGTLRTTVEGMGLPGAARRDGVIVPAPMFRDVREIPFASGSRLAMMIPWGDVATAFRTTGIPNISVYTAVSSKRLRRMRRLSSLSSLARIAPVRWALDRVASRRSGPDAAARETGWVDLWGEARSADGRVVTLAMRTPEGYRFTALSAVAAVRWLRELAEGKAGTWTPASLFGDGFVLGIPGVSLVEVDSAGQ